MIDLREIRSLTEFQRHTRDCVERLKESGKPLVLTVNGKAELVVQDAAAYQDLLERVERAETAAAIRIGMQEFAEGRGRPARAALEELRRKHDLPG